jgi:hypothetical protein
MYIDLHMKYPLYMSDFNESCIHPTDYRKFLENDQRDAQIPFYVSIFYL